MGLEKLRRCNRCECPFQKRRSPDNLHCGHCYNAIKGGISAI